MPTVSARPSGSGFVFDLDTADVQAALNRLPKIVNAELNRALLAIGGGFYKKFNPRLQGAAIKVRHAAARGRGQKRVPKEAAALGFRAIVLPRKELDGKRLEMWSGSPLTKAHEFGATILPKGERVPRMRLGGRGFGSNRQSLAPMLAIGAPPRPWRKQGSRPGENQGKVFRLVRKVVIPARLGFYNTWKEHESDARARLQKAADNIEKRVEGASEAGLGE